MTELTSLAELAEKYLRQAARSPGIDAYEPGPKQVLFHQSEAKEKLFIGGNRSGKTVGSIAEDIMWLTGRHRYRTDLPEPPVRGRVVAVDIEDGVKKIILPEFAKWTPPSLLKNGSWEDSYDKQSRTLTLNNGSNCEFMSYEQQVEKFAGVSRHFTHFDEEPPEDIFNECLMRLVDTDGSYWIAMTPLIELTWVDERIIEPWMKGDKTIFVLEVDTSDNPHVNMTAFDRLTRGLSGEEQLTRKTGKIITHTGIIYAESFSDKSFLEGGNLIYDIVPRLHEYLQGWGHFICMDHGLQNPTVFLFCAFDNKGWIIVYDELYISGKENRLVKDNAERYLEKLEQLAVVPVYCVGDPNIQNRNAITGTSVQSEYFDHGVTIALGNNDVDAGIVRVQNLFGSRKLFISERCVETRKEIKNYRWDRFTSSKIAARRNAKEKPLKRNDHCMDALRYGVMSRPFALEGEALPVGNVLGAPFAGAHDMDYELCFQNPEKRVTEVDW